MIDADYVNSTFGLEGKNAIITGGNSGIGKGIAEAFAKLGANVCITGRNEDRLEAVVSSLSSYGHHEYKRVDVSSRNDIDQFFEWYESNHDKLDIFVNNAGYSVHGELQNAAYEDIDGMIETNLKGAILCMQHASRIMMKQKSGRILIITSINGVVNAHPEQGMYSVTKFGLQGAMKALASSLGEYGITVNSLAPGAIDTPINSVAFSNTDTVHAVENKITLHRIGTIEEVGDVAAAMVSDCFRYMTGSTVVVDGGMMLRQK